MLNIAFCLSGAVSKKKGAFNKANDLYVESEYVDYNICYETIKKHILDINNCNFDFFIHCWNKDLELQLNNLYKPKNYLYEDNTLYNHEISSLISKPEYFAAASRALSIKKSIGLIDDLSFYDLIIIYRPDLWLNKNINLQNYNLNKIYVNKFHSCNGDFHFIMNSKLAYKFKSLYDSAKYNPPENHVWIKNYILNFLKEDIIEDNIIAGKDQEVIRKMYD